MLFDTHIHLDRLGPDLDLDEELAVARDLGVQRYLVPGVEPAGWEDVLRVAARTAGCCAAFGVHPLAAELWDEQCGDRLREFLSMGEAVAVGEIGLDRDIDVPVHVQEKAFREQLQVAIEVSLPVLIHCRKMPGRLLEILQEERADRVGGILHAFSGSLPTARAAIDLGFGLSFGGPLTYPEARRAEEVLQQLPDDALVVETDAPDLAPHPHRGELNRPAWLTLVLKRMAEIRGWSMAEAAEITTGNACRILKLER